jgi:hypothetical protein
MVGPTSLKGCAVGTSGLAQFEQNLAPTVLTAPHFSQIGSVDIRIHRNAGSSTLE